MKATPTQQAWLDQVLREQYNPREQSGGSWWIGKSREDLAAEAQRQLTRLRNSRFGLHTNGVINS